VTEPQWLSEQEMAAWLAFLEASQLLARRLDQQARKDAGLSYAQYELLARLSAAPDRSMRMTELADTIITAKSSLTYQVSQLEKAGLVTRRGCPTDVRGVFAVLTDEGQRLLERIAPAHVHAVREYFIDLLNPEQLAALTEAMRASRDRLRGLVS